MCNQLKERIETFYFYTEKCSISGKLSSVEGGSGKEGGMEKMREGVGKKEGGKTGRGEKTGEREGEWIMATHLVSMHAD